MNTPEGKLVLIGGNFEKGHDDKTGNADGILKEVIKEVSGTNPKIEIIPFASKLQDEVEETYRRSFRKLGLDIGVMFTEDKEDVDKPEHLHRLEKADGILLSGGDQVRLANVLKGSRFLEIMNERYVNDDFLVAGSSAGAMIVSDFFIGAGGNDESLLKGTVELEEGIGILPSAVVDTHFMNRGRFSRLAESLLKKPGYIGIGLSEDSAVVVYNGNEMKAIGSGTVVIIDAGEMNHTNYDSVSQDEPVFLENLTVHFLSRGAGYLLKEKKFLQYSG
jgi:cyanophycinase